MTKTKKVLLLTFMIYSLLGICLFFFVRGIQTQNLNLIKMGAYGEYFVYFLVGFLLAFLGKYYPLLSIILVPIIYIEHYIARETNFIIQTLMKSNFLYDTISIIICLTIVSLGVLFYYLTHFKTKETNTTLIK